MQPDSQDQSASSLPPTVIVDGPKIDPAARWGEGVGEVSCAALSPDGQTVYFGLTSNALPPEVLLYPVAPYLAALSGLVGLVILVLAVLRVVRRHQRHDRAYCRKCNYDLTPVSSTPDSAPGTTICPECGATLAAEPPVRGRSTIRRLVTPVAAAVVCGILAVALAFNLAWSAPFFRTMGVQLVPLPPMVCKVLSKPLQTLSIARRESLFEAPAFGGTPVPLCSMPMTYAGITIAPDGRSLFVGDQFDGFVQIDARTGRRLQSPPMTDRVPIGSASRPIIGFTPDGRGAYIQWLDRTPTSGGAAGECGVSLWNLDTNKIDDLLATTPSAVPQQGWPLTNEFWLQSGGADWRIIETPSFLEVSRTSKWPLLAYTPRGREELASLAGMTPGRDAILNSKAGIVYSLSKYGKSVVAISTTNGQIEEELKPYSAFGHFGDGIALCESRQWLAVTDASTHNIYIRDLRAGRWIAELTTPEECYGARLQFAADGSAIAAVMMRGIPIGAPDPEPWEGGYPNDLVVWDLRHLSMKTEKPSKQVP